MRTMGRDKDIQFENATKTIRFTDAERERLREIMRRVRARSRSAAQMADPSKLIKELMGLADFGLLTDEDRQYVRTDYPPVLTTKCVFCRKPAADKICADCREDLSGEAAITRAKLDDLPYGAILLDSEGVIVAYNKAETELSRVSHRKAVGANFFTLAPCADIQEFHGRYHEFIRGTEQIQEFEFTYNFPHGTANVLITLTRLSPERVLVTAQKTTRAARRKRA